MRSWGDLPVVLKVLSSTVLLVVIIVIGVVLWPGNDEDVARQPSPDGEIAETLSSRLPDGFRLLHVDEDRYPQPQGTVARALVLVLDGPDDLNRLSYMVYEDQAEATRNFKELPQGERNVAPNGARFFTLPGDYLSFCVSNTSVGVQCYALVGRSLIRAESRNGHSGAADGVRSHVTRLLDFGANYWPELNRAL